MIDPGELDAGRWFCDHNAGAPPLPEVLEEFVAVEQRCPGNPSSVHGAGRRARGVLEQARERVAEALGLAARDVVFTSGGTEAANLAVHGLGAVDRPVLLAPVEHPACLEPAVRRGVVLWTVDASGRAQLREPEEPVGLVCLVHAQSELGTLQPVEHAIEIADRIGVPCFVDAAQTLGRVPLRSLVDAGAVVSLSPHKAGGLRGHGVLLGQHLVDRLRPLLHGGGQELGVRPGTQSPALAAANALAIERAVAEQPARARAMQANRAAFLGALADAGCDHELLTPLDASVANTAMCCFAGLDGRNLLPALDLAGVMASHGSACSSGSPTRPRVLAAMGVDELRARTCVRFSFGWREDPQSCARAAHRVVEVVARLRKKN